MDCPPLINFNLPLRILRIRVIDWALQYNFASFLDVDRATAKHVNRLDHVVYSPTRHNLKTTRVYRNFTIYPTGSATKLHFFKDAYRMAVRLHARNRYHLVYTDDPMWSGLIGYLLRRRFNLPLLIKCHSDYYSSSAWRRESIRYRLDYLFSVWMVRRADWIKAVTRQGTADLVRLGVAPDRILTFPTPIRSGLFRIAKNPNRPNAGRKILFVGRLEKPKGLPILIEAMHRLKRMGVDVRLTLVGEGSLRPFLEKQIERLGLQAHVRLSGYQPHQALRRTYHAHDFLVLPSLHEALGKVIVEAGLCGRPTVGTRVGGIPELIVPGNTGLLVPPGDAAALAGAVKTILESPGLAEEMGCRAAQTYRRRFAFPSILTRQLEMFSLAAGGDVSADRPASRRNP